MGRAMPNNWVPESFESRNAEGFGHRLMISFSYLVV
jgi:hypothetical protein